MAEFKFPCSQCGQQIQCDEQWIGQQISCPTCQNPLVVPASQTVAPAPPEVPQGQPRLRVNVGPAPTPVAAPQVHEPQTPAYAFTPPPSKPEASGSKKWIKIAAVVIGFGIGFFFALKLANSWQEKFNTADAQRDHSSGGGQLGHIADLYDVLDKTDPDKMAEESSRSLRRAEAEARRQAEAAKPAPIQPLELSSTPVQWTLDLAAATVPEGKANGMLAGTNFVVDTARLNPAGRGHVLTLKQGTNAAADWEFSVYLYLGAGEELAGHNWKISADTRGKNTPQIVKKWRPNPRYAPVQKLFSTGYAMELEFGAATNGYFPGKIFLSLPDTEKSVVAGLFRAEMPAPKFDFGSEELDP